MKGADCSSLIIQAEIAITETGHKPRTRTKGSRVRSTSRAYSDAGPGLVCPAVAAAAAAASAAVGDSFFFLAYSSNGKLPIHTAKLRRLSFVLVQFV